MGRNGAGKSTTLKGIATCWSGAAGASSSWASASTGSRRI